VCLCVFARVVCAHACVSRCVYVRAYVRVYVCVWVYVYTCVCVCRLMNLHLSHVCVSMHVRLGSTD